jgi:hypothetical protein
MTKGLNTFSSLVFLVQQHLSIWQKNIGMNVVKPDRHLVRLADALNYSTPDKLCKEIANHLDEKMSVVDVVLWRYCVMNPNYLAMIQRFKVE